MRSKAIIQWGISSCTGWGVYGLNLALHWSADPEVEPLCSLPLNADALALDPLRRRALQDFLTGSAELQAQLQPFAERPVQADRPVLLALGNEMVTTPAAHRAGLTGRPTIGVVFFESPSLSPAAVARAERLDLIVAGSSWNEDLLRAHGLRRVTTVLQGIDPTLFHPAPAMRPMRDRFLVFSGGKLEPRKGQDLVLAGFARFARHHPEAVLATAWHSPWPALARGMERAGHVGPVTFNAAGQPDSAAWAERNGVPREQFLDLGQVANAFMPSILREMDVALFPNRCEGGTNLVAMECMACGVPTILSANTGHLDLIDPGDRLVLRRQAPVHGGDGVLTGWGESSVDEVAQRLEQAHADRAASRAEAMRAAARIGRLTWAATATAMKRIVLDQPSCSIAA